MFKFVKEINDNVLDITELKQLRLNHYNFVTNKTDITCKENYFNSVIIFFDWYISYCKNIINEKTYPDKQICECLFRPIFKTEGQFIEYLIKSIYVSKDYVEHLKTSINVNNIHIFEHTLSSLDVDLEELIGNIEVTYKHSVGSIELNSGRRKNLSLRDIYSAARTLFFIEEFKGIEDLYLRDLKPFVMFQIRQLLEVFGKNIIGYYLIVDNEGNSIKKFTQVAWDFIKEEIKKPDSRIIFPFDPHMIMAINNWANNFVHTTYLYNSYIQYFALKVIHVLFAVKTEKIKIYNGKYCKKFIADIKIINYNSLKLDFELYIRDKMSIAVVKWMNINEVDAYILSE